MPDRAEAWAVLTQYNKNEFHLRHALTEESVMRWFAAELGHGDEADFWALVGLLHDLDFEGWPGQHCHKTEALMRELDWDERLIHAVVSHGYGLVTDVKPEHEMEKILFATDELTGLIGAAAIIRPSRSVMDLELKSVKKKFKTENFAAGCSRAVIKRGAAMLGWELDKLMEWTIRAMRASEEEINAFFVPDSAGFPVQHGDDA
ncbi:MAG: hydrolase [Gracilibacteraceae bacterium]|nr:hydrolase [Gracilibacteraceae bacterium]